MIPDYAYQQASVATGGSYILNGEKDGVALYPDDRYAGMVFGSTEELPKIIQDRSQELSAQHPDAHLLSKPLPESQLREVRYAAFLGIDAAMTEQFGAPPHRETL